jgi:hypothetical protein
MSFICPKIIFRQIEEKFETKLVAIFDLTHFLLSFFRAVVFVSEVEFKDEMPDDNEV